MMETNISKLESGVYRAVVTKVSDKVIEISYTDKTGKQVKTSFKDGLSDPGYFKKIIEGGEIWKGQEFNMKIIKEFELKEILSGDLVLRGEI